MTPRVRAAGVSVLSIRCRSPVGEIRLVAAQEVGVQCARLGVQELHQVGSPEAAVGAVGGHGMSR